VIAVLILVAGGLNNSVAFDIDYVAGTASAVSLLWVSAVIAALVFVAGAAAAWMAQSATTATRRKLEAELQSTYERLREAEALAARSARSAQATVAQAPVAVAAATATEVAVERDAAPTAMTTTAAADEAQTVVAAESRTAFMDEGKTIIADDGGDAGGSATVVPDPGQTAVTMAVAADDGPDDGDPQVPDVAGTSPDTPSGRSA